MSMFWRLTIKSHQEFLDTTHVTGIVKVNYGAKFEVDIKGFSSDKCSLKEKCILELVHKKENIKRYDLIIMCIDAYSEHGVFGAVLTLGCVLQITRLSGNHYIYEHPLSTVLINKLADGNVVLLNSFDSEDYSDFCFQGVFESNFEFIVRALSSLKLILFNTSEGYIFKSNFNADFVVDGSFIFQKVYFKNGIHVFEIHSLFCLDIIASNVVSHSEYGLLFVKSLEFKGGRFIYNLILLEHLGKWFILNKLELEMFVSARVKSCVYNTSEYLINPKGQNNTVSANLINQTESTCHLGIHSYIKDGTEVVVHCSTSYMSPIIVGCYEASDKDGLEAAKKELSIEFNEDVKLAQSLQGISISSFNDILDVRTADKNIVLYTEKNYITNSKALDVSQKYFSINFSKAMLNSKEMEVSTSLHSTQIEELELRSSMLLISASNYHVSTKYVAQKTINSHIFSKVFNIQSDSSRINSNKFSIKANKIILVFPGGELVISETGIISIFSSYIKFVSGLTTLSGKIVCSGTPNFVKENKLHEGPKHPKVAAYDETSPEKHQVKVIDKFSESMGLKQNWLDGIRVSVNSSDITLDKDSCCSYSGKRRITHFTLLGDPFQDI